MPRRGFKVPSGRIFDHQDLALFELMHQYKFIEWRENPFTLNSGIKSHVYVFGREDLTDNPQFTWEVGKVIANIIKENALPTDKQICLIGIPTAGTAMAQAASMVSFCDGIIVGEKPICYRIMREIQKSGHGDKSHQQNWVNGRPDVAKHTYVTLDNVVTDGASKFQANERLAQSGYPVKEMPSFIFINRQQGGVQKMEEKGFKRIIVAYKLLDITFVLGELRFWPKEAVQQVEEEIKAHQFKAHQFLAEKISRENALLGLL